MFVSIFLLFVVQTFLCPAEAYEISCRSIASVNWDEVGEQKTCDLSISAAIDIDNVRFEGEADDTIGALDLRALSTNSFLPIEVDAKFPALVLYQSCCASIKTISKKNFKNLSSLRFLSLADNQIEKIPNDTFEDLKALEWIELHRNKIKFLNGNAFAGLINLKSVGLNTNECINEYFEGKDIAAISEIVKEKCSFDVGKI